MKKRLHAGTLRFIAAVMAIGLIVNSCEVDDLLNSSLQDLEGEWLCTEESELIGHSSYTVYISVNPENSNQIIIDDFYDVGIGVVASVSFGSTITISNYSEAGYVVNGSGSISNNRRTINLSYSVSDSSGDPDECTATYVKI